jgi:hypothetical protein
VLPDARAGTAANFAKRQSWPASLAGPSDTQQNRRAGGRIEPTPQLRRTFWPKLSPGGAMRKS